MWTQKHFTPALLQRFARQGRSTGTYQDYIPWHRVGRGDPSSIGRSHLTMWQNRQRELLSDNEWVGLLFSTMLHDLVDIREQHGLALADGPRETSYYDARCGGESYPGTLAVASSLGFKHPRVNGDGISCDWRMTTDQVLVFRSSSGPLEMLAVAYKAKSQGLTKRSRQLLAIEKEYWNRRGIAWILVTPELFCESVGLTLRRAAPWGLGKTASASEIAVAVDSAVQTRGRSLTGTLNSIARVLGEMDLAQRAFWQGVWCGAIPMDLRTGWRPHLPVELLSQDAFMALNPIASRRTSWS